MKFLHIIAEGATEESFVKKVLTPHFAPLGIYIQCQRLTTNWRTGDKGGLLKYAKLRKSILKWIEADKRRHNVWYSTMVDLYAFPKDDQSPYDARVQAFADKYQLVEELEKGMAANIAHDRFVPYVQLHEFETFLLVDATALDLLFPESRTGAARLLKEVADQNVELINDRPEYAPSKRVQAKVPAYESLKSTAGPLIAEHIGLVKLRENCRHFHDWMNRLEAI